MALELSFKKKEKTIGRQTPMVDLMPLSRSTAVDLAKTKVVWRKAVIYTTAFVIVLSVCAIGWRIYSQMSYTSAVASQDAVNAEIIKYKDVDLALGIESEIGGLQTQAAGSEISWSSLLNRIQGQLPPGTSISGFSVASGGGDGSEVSSSVIIKVNSGSPDSYSQVLNAFSSLDGVSDIQIGNITSASTAENISYVYPVAFAFDSSILTNKYNPQEETE